MPPSHAQAQDLAESVYLTARKTVLSSLGRTLEKLDAVYVSDAKRIQLEMQRLLKGAGVPPKEIKKAIDGVFAKSRPKRIELVADAIRHATATATAADEKTFRAVFEGDREAAVPLGRGRSASPRSPTPWLRLVSASGGSSPATS